MFSRAMKDALAEKVVSQRFTFHDLRAHYATQHKRALGALPDLHADPARRPASMSARASRGAKHCEIPKWEFLLKNEST